MLYQNFKDFVVNLPEKGQLLGIDWGSRRTGVAISDESREFVFPREIIVGIPQSRIAEIIQSEKIVGIIIGLPVWADGTDSKTTRHVRVFANELAQIAPDIPIAFVDESLSSVAAEESIRENRINRGKAPRSVGKKKVRVDAAAAAVILTDALRMIEKQIEQ